MKKKNLYFVLIFMMLFFIKPKFVLANIMCNDGTESPSCSDCHQGCCSWHGGCADNDYSDSSEEDTNDGSLIPLLLVGGGICGTVLYEKNKNKKQ